MPASTTPPPDWDWKEEARCNPQNEFLAPGGLPMDPNIFHPTEPESEEGSEFFELEQKSHELAVGYAKRICGLCPVKQECLDFAIATNEKEGIWGGKTWNERR